MSDRARIGGLLVRAGGELRFLPAVFALRVAPPPRITPVPGAPPGLLGVTLHEGAIIPVLAIGSSSGQMIVCRHAGELVGVVGADVVKAASLQPTTEDARAVEHQGQDVQVLDVGSLYERVQSAARPQRWG